jgi:hypothetical protein
VNDSKVAVSLLCFQRFEVVTMEEGVVMQLYWDCQELRAQLESASAPERPALIQQSIQVSLFSSHPAVHPGLTV